MSPLTCYHEAGHAIRACFLSKESLVEALTILEPVEGDGWNGQAGTPVGWQRPRTSASPRASGGISEFVRSPRREGRPAWAI
jgi:hypothetical protein